MKRKFETKTSAFVLVLEAKEDKEFQRYFDKTEGLATYESPECIAKMQKDNPDWDKAKQLRFLEWMIIKGLNEHWFVTEYAHERLIDDRVKAIGGGKNEQ